MIWGVVIIYPGQNERTIIAKSLTAHGIAEILTLISALDIIQGDIGRGDHDTSVIFSKEHGGGLRVRPFFYPFGKPKKSG